MPDDIWVVQKVQWFARGASHGRRWGGGAGFWKFQQKTVVFLVSSGKNQISPLLVLIKSFEKPPRPPSLAKSFRRPWCYSFGLITLAYRIHHLLYRKSVSFGFAVFVLSIYFQRALVSELKPDHSIDRFTPDVIIMTSFVAEHVREDSVPATAALCRRQPRQPLPAALGGRSEGIKEIRRLNSQQE